MRVPPRILWFVVASLVFLAALCPRLSAEDTASSSSGLATLLARPVLFEKQTLAEVRKYCDRRIAVMPRPTTWSAWQREAERLERDVLDDVVFRGVPEAWRAASRQIEWLDTIPGGRGYHIRKLRYEALPGLWIPALLYEPDQLKDRVPVVLNVNGHDSDGKSATYKQIRCINLAKRGMLALNLEWLGTGQLQGDGFSHDRMNQLDLCGISGLAVFYLAMERGLDILLDHPHADADRVAMAGLSGGGWQTIFLSSLDRRIKLANPVAGYSSVKTQVEFFSDLGDSEQLPTDLAMLADYTHLTALRAPRPTLLTYNTKDECCFLAGHALQPLLDAATPVYRLAGAEKQLRSHVNDDPGTHNFERENREAFYQMLGNHFYGGDDSFDAKEIEVHREVRSAKELDVDLPRDNLDFHKLALAQLPKLPSYRVLNESTAPCQESAATITADSLSAIIRLAKYQPAATFVHESNVGDTKARFWRISLGDDWTVPVVELWRGTPKGTSCVAAEDGRTSAVVLIEKLLSAGQRVLAVDCFYLGESKLEDRGYRFALLLSSVGSRPVGVQASQLQAVAHWANSQFDGPLERQIAIGPRITLAALIAVASGVSEERPRRLELHASLHSLREVIENDWSVEQYPELFCFGLFQHCDIDDLIELARPCVVVRQ